jgi:hypothetical protein
MANDIVYFSHGVQMSKVVFAFSYVFRVFLPVFKKQVQLYFDM